MATFVFTKKAEKIFLDSPPSDQKRIIEKLKNLKEHTDIFSILRRLNHFEPATHRLRIGHIRLILELKIQTRHETRFWILDMGDRKNIYKPK